MARQQQSDEPDAPPRRKKLGLGMRVLLVSLAVILAGVVVHWQWGNRSERLLREMVEQYRLAGEPVAPSDLNSPAVAPALNAVPDLRAAARKIDQRSADWQTLTGQMELAPPLTEKEAKLLGDFLAKHDQSLTLVRRARQKGLVDWQMQVRSPVIATLLPDLNEQRALSQLLSMATLHAHHAGDDAAALEYVRDALFVSRAADHQPFLVGHLVSVGIGTMASHRAAEIGPELQIADTSRADGARPATPEQLRTLIDELLDDKPSREGHRNGLRGERVGQLDTALAVAEGRMPLWAITGGPPAAGPPAAVQALVRYPLRPAMLADARLMLQYTTKAIEAAEAPDWPTARKVVPDDQQMIRYKQNPAKHLLLSILMPSLVRSTEQHYRGMTDRRMAATALAVRWYAAEHDGRLPAKLEDLVPRYLPAVPLDAMAAGQALGYVPGGDRPVVYSVGANGTDEGGSDKPTRRGTPPGNRWAEEDAVVYLKVQPRKPPPPDEGESQGEWKPVGQDVPDEAPATQGSGTTQPTSAPVP